jgi:monofunctional biosynthetic peptidoglycan transglycosylase
MYSKQIEKHIFAQMKLKGAIPRLWRFCKRLLFWLFIFHLIYILYGRWFNPPITFTQIGALIDGYGLRRDYVNDEDISPNLKLAVIASEDQEFLDHEGIDWEEIEKARQWNRTHSSKRGGSTISQQTAKNFFLWQGRTYLRKGLEAYFTKMIEWTWSKDRILESYLNIIEMGKGVFGAEAAAKHYFHKSAKNLTMEESALIAAILPNPKVYTIQPMHARVKLRYPRILKQMRNIRGDKDIKEFISPEDVVNRAKK